MHLTRKYIDRVAHQVFNIFPMARSLWGGLSYRKLASGGIKKICSMTEQVFQSVERIQILD